MTAREKVLLQREAFVAGAGHVRDVYRLNITAGTTRADNAAAAEAYPMPTVTRDRTVDHHGLTYRCKDGVLEYRHAHGDWESSANTVADFGSDIGKIADLILHPTETVEVAV